MTRTARYCLKGGLSRIIINLISLALCLLFPSIVNEAIVNSQESNDTIIKYTPEFKFREGVFLNFKDVLYNNPIPKGRLLTDTDYSSNDFFDKVLTGNKLYYIDNIGNRLELSTSRLWGYSRNGFLYVKIGDGYYRITLMGSCCHFVAYKTYEVRSTGNPYYNSYQYPYSQRSPTVSTQSEMQQYLLDFRNGNILEYKVEGVEIILMNDPELHNEYMQLSNKKKKQLKFVFIRKYNQRNPLYLIKKK